MTWAENLIKACKDKNFDLSIVLTKHSNGIDLYSFTSNLTFDNFILDLTAYPAFKDTPWWIVGPLSNGKRPTVADFPVNVIYQLKTKADADGLVHKGKRVVSIACWQTYAVAETTGDYFNKYIKVTI